MTQKTAKFTKGITVLLTPEQDKKISQVAESQAMQVGPMVRKLINSAWDHRFGNVPTCASAETCRCPAMHAVRSPIDPLPNAG